MIVLVTGSRNPNETPNDRVFAALTHFSGTHWIERLIFGDARGVDAAALSWATYNRVGYAMFAANWTGYGAAAGPRRNQRMVDEKPDVCIFFPGGTGTGDCVRRAKAARIHCIDALDILASLDRGDVKCSIPFVLT